MQSISFQLKVGEDPFVVDFDKFDINVLHSINRILDIEEFEDILVIGVDNTIYRQVGDFVANNCWCQHLHKEGQYDLKLDGHELILIKHE